MVGTVYNFNYGDGDVMS